MKIFNITMLFSLGCLLLLLPTSHAKADNNGGSAYSRYGLGDLQYFPSPIAAGMGGANIAVLPTDEFSRINPATWVRINRARFSIGMTYEGYSTSDESHSSFLSGTTFNGFGLAFPIATQSGVVLSFGLTPYSRINYNVKTTDTTGDLGYQLQYQGSGGLTEGYIGLSASPARTFHVGAEFNYLFGTCNYITRQTFSGNYTNADLTRSMEFHGADFTFGAVWSGLNTLLGLPPASALNVGAVFTSAVDLSTATERSYLFNTSSYITHDTLDTPGGITHIPIGFGGGLSFATERILVAADFMAQNWSSFLLNDAAVPEIRNSYRLSAGAEILPQRDPGAPAFQKWRYRFGFFYNASYYRLRNEPINETGVTGGFGIPIIGDMKINIAAEYSMRGTTDNRLQKDRIIRLSFSLSGGEMWFVRPPEE